MKKLFLSFFLYLLMIALLMQSVYSFFLIVYFSVCQIGIYYAVAHFFLCLFIYILILLLLKTPEYFLIESKRKYALLVFPALCFLLLSLHIIPEISGYSIYIYILYLCAYALILFFFIFEKTAMLIASLCVLSICVVIVFMKADIILKSDDINMYIALFISNIVSIHFLSSFASYFITDKVLKVRLKKIESIAH